MKPSKSMLLLLCSLYLLAALPVLAADEVQVTAEKMMVWQLEALKKGERKLFIEKGNRAFKSLVDDYTFDSFRLQNQAKIAKGYRLDYLGKIRSIGMVQYLWRVRINGSKYQLLGRISLADGRVVGFHLE